MFFRLYLNATKLVKRADLNAELSAPLVKSRIADPPLRQISLMGIPASACLMNPVICYSLNLLSFVSVILHGDGLARI
jgi:hypothetical protein